MKRLLGLLLVMGMVGCGGGDEAPPAGETVSPATPKTSQANVDEPPVVSAAADPSVESASVSPTTPADAVDNTPAQSDDVDPVVSLKELGAQIERNEQGEVVRVNLFGTKITDAGMADLKGLTNLQKLNLDGTSVTDAGIVHLVGLTKLTHLSLPYEITDAGLVHLKGLTTLQELNLGSTQVTDAGLVHLLSLIHI